MKSIKRFFPWLLVMAVIITTSCFAVAGSTVSFQGVAIRLNGNKVSSPGDTYAVANGSNIPYSILYQDEQGGGTTFVSLRKMSELLGVTIDWDSTTSEVVIERNETEPDKAAIPFNGVYNTQKDGASFQFHYTNGVQDPIVDVTLPNGASYHGACIGTSITGYGTMIFPEKGLYSGDFLDGEKNGDGTFVWNDGPRYVGQWLNDEMNGEGIYYYNSGMTEKLVGTFSHNRPDGALKYYDENGTCYDTRWASGTCVSSVPES